MSSRSPFFDNGIIPFFTHISALPPFQVLLQNWRSWILRAPVFQNTMGILSSPDALLFLKPLMYFFSSSMVKFSVLICSPCWNAFLVGLEVIAGGFPNKFQKWSIHFLPWSSGFFTLILPLFALFLTVNSSTVSHRSIFFWSSAAVLILSAFPWTYLSYFLKKASSSFILASAKIFSLFLVFPQLE